MCASGAHTWCAPPASLSPPTSLPRCRPASLPGCHVPAFQSAPACLLAFRSAPPAVCASGARSAPSHAPSPGWLAAWCAQAAGGAHLMRASSCPVAAKLRLPPCQVASACAELAPCSLAALRSAGCGGPTRHTLLAAGRDPDPSCLSHLQFRGHGWLPWLPSLPWSVRTMHTTLLTLTMRQDCSRDCTRTMPCTVLAWSPHSHFLVCTVLACTVSALSRTAGGGMREER